MGVGQWAGEEGHSCGVHAARYPPRSSERCLYCLAQYCLQYIVPSVTETGPEILEDTFRWVGGL